MLAEVHEKQGRRMKIPTTVRTAAALLAGAVGVTACGSLKGNPQPELVTTASYQPFGVNYRGVSFGRTIQHFDERATETDFGMRYFVRTDVIPAGDGFEATFVLDSILLFDEARGGISGAQVDSTRGATFHAALARNGQMTNFSGGESSGSLARELADRSLRPFFPLIPDRGAEAGAVWVDTLDTQVVVNGLDNSIRLVSEHSALEWTLHAGERALHILTVSNYTFNGSGTQAGREFTIEGSGRRHIHRYLSEDGRYLGLVSADTSDGEAHLIDLDMVIPIQQTRIDSLSSR
jgi:hypothetical protein